MHTCACMKGTYQKMFFRGWEIFLGGAYACMHSMRAVRRGYNSALGVRHLPKKCFFRWVEIFFWGGAHACTHMCAAGTCTQCAHVCRGYNSALGGHRVVIKVANERYCNIVQFFCIFFVHMHAHVKHAHERRLPKKIMFF